MNSGLAAIGSRKDALVWRAVDRFFDGEMSSLDAAEWLILELNRSQANHFLGEDWIVELLRRTDPARSGSETAVAA